MAVTTQVLFNTPQHEIASLIRDRINRCTSTSIVSGFVTVEGVRAVAQAILARPDKLQTLLVGAGTYRAFEAFDGLISNGVPADRFFVHLGHTAPSGRPRKPFHKYHPMLHSKIFFMEMPDGHACAFVGSNNLTGFAMFGQNGEAAVLLEGPSNAPEFDTIREHIQKCRSQASVYSPSMKEALNWWTIEFIDGLRDEANDAPRDGDPTKTIVILAARADDPLPQSGDTIYFEIPTDLGQITSLTAEVHIYIFPTKPTTPYQGLATLAQARAPLWCRTTGLELEQGGAELKADWFIVDKTDPTLLPAPRPFRPSPSPGMQQVRVKVSKKLTDTFEYLFDTVRERWEPIYERGPAGPSGLRTSKFVPAGVSIESEVDEWFLVKGLRPAEDKAPTAFDKALVEASPEAGSYILFSLRRRKREKPSPSQRK